MKVLNPQTEKKIKEIKKSIADKIDLKEIRKLKFGTFNKMNEWLKKNYIYFSEEELEYLDFTIPIQIVEDEELEKKKASHQNDIVKVSEITPQALLSFSPKDKMNFILSDDILTLLLNLSRKSSIIAVNEELKVPIEYSKLQDLKVTNCRLSADIYKRFAEFCEKNNFTITSLMNYVLDDFLKKFDNDK